MGWGPDAVSPGSYSTLAPSASARKPSRATSASLSRGGNGRDGIGSLVPRFVLWRILWVPETWFGV